MKTITILIGNSDDKLTQKEWSLFVSDCRSIIEARSEIIHFFGAPENHARWQNVCWVAEIKDERFDTLCELLCKIRKQFSQDSIAVIDGTAKFI